MNRRHFIVGGSLSMIGAGCVPQPRAESKGAPAGLTALQERKPMPAFSLPDMDGRIVRSSDVLGSVAILRFWATW